MQRPFIWPKAALTALVLVTVTACPAPAPSDDAGEPDAGAPADDAGAPPDDNGDGGPVEGEPDAGPGDDAGPPPGPVIDAAERVGAYLPAALASVLPSETTSRVLLGYRGTPVDPAWFGLPEGDLRVDTGLIVLDRDDGTARVLTAADGLPTYDYGVSDGAQTAPVFDLAWVEDGVRFVAAAWSHLVVGTFDGSSVTFDAVTLRAPGAARDAAVTGVAVAGGRILAASDEGLAVLDPESLDVTSWVDLAIGVARPYAWGIEAGTFGGGEVAAVIVGVPDANPTHVAVVRIPDDTSAPVAEAIAFGGKQPLSTAFAGERLLVGLSDAGFGEIAELQSDGGALSFSTWATRGQLTPAEAGNVLPNRLAYDPGVPRLVVGGRILPGSLAGGGLIALPIDILGAAGQGADLFDRRDPYKDLFPDQVDVLTAAPGGHLYVAGRNLCSESRLGRVGLLRVEHNDGDVRVSRPLVSGVRTLTVEPGTGTVWLGLRDEVSGIVCEDVTVQQGVCRLRSDGACELYTPYPNTGDARILASPGVVAVAVGDLERREMALATYGEGLFLRTGDVSRVVMAQNDPVIDLNQTAVVFGEPGALWIGSEAHYEEHNDPELDDEAIYRRSPHGLGYLEVDTHGDITTSRRYVKDLSDDVDRDEVAGLPSDWVSDVLPMDGARKAIVALGRERMGRTYDHILPETSPRNVTGGVALIDDETVTVVAPPEGLAFGDVVALSRAGDDFFALDAELGVLAIDTDDATSRLVVSTPFGAGERPIALAVDVSGRIAVGTTRGLYVYDEAGGRTDVLTGGAAGFVWTMRFLEDGVVYAGTDQGLVRVAGENKVLPPLGPDGPLPRELWDLPWGCYGESGCQCDYTDDCAPGLECACEGDTCICEDPNAPDDECLRDCTCEGTLDGCWDGYFCEDSGIAGPSCVETGGGGGGACMNDCSCPDTVDGCPVGFYCEEGGVIVGGSCVPS